MRNQHKRANLDKIYNELIKTIVLENTSKENLYNRTNEPIIQGKILNKPCRNDDSQSANESIAGFNTEQLEYSNFPTSNLSFAMPHIKQESFTESVNTPRHPMNNILETPNLPRKILIIKNVSEE